MFYRTGILLISGFSLLSGSAIVAQEKSTQRNPGSKTVMVGGAPMFATKNIIENAVNSKDHTTLVAAVKAAELVETLQGEGPFTVFAPVNAAFEKLPAGTVDTLLKPENRSALQAVLTYHVVPGSMDAKALMAAAKKSNGKVELKTVNGATLWVLLNGDLLWLQDGKGTRARITTPDVYQSNGVIHVIDTVVMAK
jgi:uncharacterized surface protein with fasciclin (FAS1) repeats